MFRILITGSRAWDDHLTMMESIFDLIEAQGLAPREVTIVHGDCPDGADRLASEIAERNGIPQEAHPADWSQHGRRAGFVRNSEMVSLGADICLAFIKDRSAGASMTAKLTEKAGIPTLILSE